MSEITLYFLLGAFVGGSAVFLTICGLFLAIYRRQMERVKD